MHHTRFTLRASGAGVVSEAPLGLSKDMISQKVEKRQLTILRKAELQAQNFVEPSGPHCLLKEKRKYKPNHLTKHARKQVLDGCYCIQSKYVPHCACFFTGTLPRFSEDRMLAIDSEWSEIVRLWMAKVVYHLKRGGLDPWLVHKTEFQKDGTLHLHAVYPAKKERYHRWNITKKRAVKLWSEAIDARVSGINLDRFAYSTRVESLHTSAMGYMAKYLTKEIYGQVLDTKTEVKQFWGMTKALRDEVKSREIVFESSYYNSKIHDLHEELQCDDTGIRCSEPGLTKSHYLSMPFYASEGSRGEVIAKAKRILSEDEVWESGTSQPVSRPRASI